VYYRPALSRVGPKVTATKVAEPPKKRALDAADPFHNGQADELALKDPKLKQELDELHHDAVTFEKALPELDPKVAIVGTARSRPGEGSVNGHIDYQWVQKLGEALGRAGYSIGSGGGPGAMEAPLKGHARVEARLGWHTHEPQRQAANITLPHEQGANKYIDKGRLATFNRFLFRMEFLFRNTRDFIATPGGFGTVAEIFTYLAMKEHRQVGDPVLFGAPDDYFDKYNHAFEQLIGPGACADLQNIFHNPKKLVQAMTKAGTDGATDDVHEITADMRDDLEKGLSALDGKPPAITFIGGDSDRAKAAAPVAAAIAKQLSGDGEALRVIGSTALDPAVRAAGKDVQSFALNDSKVEGDGYTKVDDVLVLRELADTNVKGLVVTADSLDSIAMLFTTATDIQTGKMPPIPIVVLDPDGKFEALKKTLGELMLSDKRQYIARGDLDIFKVTNDPQEAVRILEGQK
jgi:predicted Rossmann-fold nucleotide-binding protein